MPDFLTSHGSTYPLGGVDGEVAEGGNQDVRGSEGGVGEIADEM